MWAYFEGAGIECKHCGKVSDLFDAMKRAADFLFSTFSAVGARQKHFSIRLRPHQVIKLDFASRIEPDSRILWVNYSSKGEDGKCVFPLEIHGNSPIRRWLPKVHLLGRAGPDTPEDFEGTVGVNVTYIPVSADDESWDSLVDAFAALHARDDADVILPANIAVEVRLTRFFQDLISKHTGLGARRIKDFLKDGATYGHQLDVLLPFTCALLSAPFLPEPVRVGLAQLKKERNSVAHSGTPNDGFDHNKAIEVAVSAALGCVYVDYLRQKFVQ